MQPWKITMACPVAFSQSRSLHESMTRSHYLRDIHFFFLRFDGKKRRRSLNPVLDTRKRQAVLRRRKVPLPSRQVADEGENGTRARWLDIFFLDKEKGFRPEFTGLRDGI